MTASVLIDGLINYNDNNLVRFFTRCTFALLPRLKLNDHAQVPTAQSYEKIVHIHAILLKSTASIFYFSDLPYSMNILSAITQ